MKRYVYKHKKTGKKVESDTPLASKELVLVTQLRDGKMKGHQISKK